MNQLENCQARYCSNIWMDRTRTEGPDVFEPAMFHCMFKKVENLKGKVTLKASASKTHTLIKHCNLLQTRSESNEIEESYRCLCSKLLKAI